MNLRGDWRDAAPCVRRVAGCDARGGCAEVMLRRVRFGVARRHGSNRSSVDVKRRRLLVLNLLPVRLRTDALKKGARRTC